MTTDTLRGKNIGVIAACQDLGLLYDACEYAGVPVSQSQDGKAPFMQRELARRIVATAIIKLYPDVPAKDDITTEILESAADYNNYLGTKFSRYSQATDKVTLQSTYVNQFLPEVWRKEWPQENDPFAPAKIRRVSTPGATASGGNACNSRTSPEKDKNNTGGSENQERDGNQQGNKGTPKKTENFDDGYGLFDNHTNKDTKRKLPAFGGHDEDKQYPRDFKNSNSYGQQQVKTESHDYWKNRRSSTFDPLAYSGPQQPNMESGFRQGGQQGFSRAGLATDYYAGDPATRQILNNVQRQYGNNNNNVPRQGRRDESDHENGPQRNQGQGGGGGDDDPGDSSEGSARTDRSGRNRGGHRQGRGRRLDRGQRDGNDDAAGQRPRNAPTDKDRRALTGLQQNVPLFTGLMPYNFREWFRKFELRTSGCTAKQKCLGLALLMDGHAAVLFERLPVETRFNYPAVVAELFRLFAPPENVEVAMQKFREHYQQKGVDVFQYVNELRSLLASAGCELPPAQYDQLIAQQFKQGLLPRWRREITRYFGSATPNLDQMVGQIAALTQVDDTETENRKKPVEENRQKPFRTVRFTDEMKRAAEREELEAMAKDLASLPYPNRSISPQAPRAAFIDHKKPNDQNMKQGNGGPRPRSPSPFASKQQNQNAPCFICDKPGHWVRDCPFKDEWQAMKKKLLTEIREKANKGTQILKRNNIAVGTSTYDYLSEPEDSWDDYDM